jgi:hypothetical protein
LIARSREVADDGPPDARVEALAEVLLLELQLLHPLRRVDRDREHAALEAMRPRVHRDRRADDGVPVRPQLVVGEARGVRQALEQGPEHVGDRRRRVVPAARHAAPGKKSPHLPKSP